MKKWIYPPKKRAVLIALAILIVLLLALIFLKPKPQTNPLVIQTEGHPTIGNPNASIHLVLIEEPKCRYCKQFSNEIYPEIKRDFIDTGKVKYTVIIVSFLPNSSLAAEALLASYEPAAHTEKFFSYLDYLYKNQPDESSDWATHDRLLALAKKSHSEIDSKQLKSDLETRRYQARIEKNTAYCTTLLHGKLVTPTLFINGIQIKELTYSEIKKEILELIKNEDSSPSIQRTAISPCQKIGRRVP